MPNESTPRDVFLHLLAIAALYISAISFATLLFQYVNYWVPDPLQPFHAGDAIRWALATLLILFPVHALTVRYIHRDMERTPAKREFRLRKWLLYLTLFLAAVTLITDLVALIYNFLAGELTLRFILKIVAIALVAGGVFIYYWWELRRREIVVSAREKTVLWSIVALVMIMIVVGFFVVGSPFKQRDIKFDQRRVNDLQNIQWQIVNYWQQKQKLPAELSDLNDAISGYISPVDPVAGVAYEYRVTGTTSFELCGTFQRTSDEDINMRSGKYSVPVVYPEAPASAPDNNWQHDMGRVCFSRTIDPDLYPPQQRVKP